MHDKYCYERIEMALHDRDVVRFCATGVAGLSTVVDALSAMKYGKVRPVRDSSGLVRSYEIEGEFPTYGNNDERADDIAVDIVKRFMAKLRTQPTYRDSIPTLSILTITSNVVYGKKTGDTPDGRKAGEPLAPGANPYHGRDKRGAIAAMSSVAKLPYHDAADGISYTFSITPGALGNRSEDRTVNLVGLLDGYFDQGGHHINVNVLSREMLLEAIEAPDRYPQLTVRVSGYAVHFHKLTLDQKKEVVSRTFYDRL
jgi:formate C-acetyltransferase